MSAVTLSLLLLPLLMMFRLIGTLFTTVSAVGDCTRFVLESWLNALNTEEDVFCLAKRRPKNLRKIYS